MQIAANSLGNLIFAKTHLLRERWGPLARGQSFGRWMSGRGPMMGVFTTQTKEGMHVDHVYAGTPAAKAGLRAGDVIVKVDGVEVGQYTEFGGALADKDPGMEVTALVRRGQQTFERKMRLIPRQSFPPPPKPGSK